MNTTSNDILLDLGANRIEAFRFEITDQQGHRVCTSHRKVVSGISIPGKLLILPGESHEEKVVLNQWCSTKLSPGSYTVLCLVRYGSGEVSSTCIINIVQADDKELDRIFSRIKQEILSEGTAIEPILFKTKLLAYANSDVAASHLAEIARNRGSLGAEGALEGLGRLASERSVRELLSIIQDDTDTIPSHIRSKAISIVHAIAKSTKDPKTRSLCQKATQNTLK